VNLNSVLLLPRRDGVGIHRLKPVEDVKMPPLYGARSMTPNFVNFRPGTVKDL